MLERGGIAVGVLSGEYINTPEEQANILLIFQLLRFSDANVDNLGSKIPPYITHNYSCTYSPWGGRICHVPPRNIYSVNNVLIFSAAEVV